MSRLLALFLAGVLASGEGSAGAEPYDLRGIKLGMELEKFREMKSPEDDGARVICGDDAEARKPDRLNDLYALRSGGVACKYFKWGKPLVGSKERWNEAGPRVATVGVFSTFHFEPSPAAPKKLILSQIEIRSNVMYWDTFMEGYTGKYGKPTNSSKNIIQNGFGASFDQERVRWVNAESAIELVKRDRRVDRVSINYVHLGIEAAHAAERRAKLGAPKDGL